MSSEITNVETKKEEKRRNIFVEIIKFTLAALLIVTPLRLFVAQPFIVSGNSMEPTFDSRQYLVIDQLTYRFSPPKRGDVVIFHYPHDPALYFIKRIIGLPGETIEVTDGAVSVQGAEDERVHLIEPYLADDNIKKESSTTTLDDDEYFVLGDNRKHSSDSRLWGPLKKRFVVGRAYLRLLPVSTLEYLPGKYEYEL